MFGKRENARKETRIERDEKKKGEE